MYKSRLLELAKTDVNESSKWYNQQQIGLGKRFIVEVRATIGKINVNPFAYGIKFNATRAAKLDSFPYLIFYEVFENQKLIII